MERASADAGFGAELEAAVLAAAVRAAAADAAREEEPLRAIDAAVATLHGEVGGIFPSVFVLEHGRLWVVAQRGYALVPDGIPVGHGIMGRAIQLGRGQVVTDVRSDPDYIEGLPGVTSEAAVPLRVGRVSVGALNLESERPLPKGTVTLLRPLASALAPRAQALRASGELDVSALVRLFVYLGSLREPDQIAGLAAASLARVLKLESSQVWLWDHVGAPVELVSWRADGHDRPTLSLDELERARSLVDPSFVCQVLELRPSGRRKQKPRRIVWLPLRVNGEEIGALVGSAGGSRGDDPSQLDTPAVLAAHVAASLDAALALQRERQSAVTDSLTTVLNRRGLEEQLEEAVASAQERRAPLSILVLDCDDFKEVNDRAGHAFGDTLLREVADVLARSVPENAVVGRLGGDEFVVVLSEAGAETAEELGGRIRTLMAEGLTEAGYPLHFSAGVSTYPFDGATPTALLRAADQALYVAKANGKDRVASFRHVLMREEPPGAKATARPPEESRRRTRSEGSVLADALGAVRAMEAEETLDGVLSRLCKALVFIVGATGCSVSRVAGGYLVDATEHALREVWLGDPAAYRISDFPLTEETLRTGEPRAVSFLEGDVEPSEAFILRELGMTAMLMVPLRVRGRPWGLVELYEMRQRKFSADDISVAQFLATQAERRLGVIAPQETPTARPPVYELPNPDEPGEEPGAAPRAPRSR